MSIIPEILDRCMDYLNYIAEQYQYAKDIGDMPDNCIICLFGSILTDRFRDDSDIDVLIVFPYSDHDIPYFADVFYRTYLGGKIKGHRIDLFVTNNDLTVMFDSSDSFSNDVFDEAPNLADEIVEMFKKNKMVCLYF